MLVKMCLHTYMMCICILFQMLSGAIETIKPEAWCKYIPGQARNDYVPDLHRDRLDHE